MRRAMTCLCLDLTIASTSYFSLQSYLCFHSPRCVVFIPLQYIVFIPFEVCWFHFPSVYCLHSTRGMLSSSPYGTLSSFLHFPRCVVFIPQSNVVLFSKVYCLNSCSYIVLFPPWYVVLLPLIYDVFIFSGIVVDSWLAFIIKS